MARGPPLGRFATANGHNDDDDQSHQGDKANAGAGRREGSIVKITMKDFITYDSVECVPGESLNVVIGPNGTGKSTILCAIVLGLGGKPAVLGKPNTPIQDFIKNNRNDAQITIELFRHRRNTIIKRTILKDGKSIWNLNGRNASLKEVEAETKSLNIQIDNLCQVLAQDRVQDFAKLNKQELLEATQKAVGKEGMSEVHAKLKDLQREQKSLETQIAVAKKQRETEQGHVDRLRGEVEKVEKRRGIEQEAEACKLKLTILTYKARKDELDRYKRLKKDADQKVVSIRAQIEPFTERIKEVETKYKIVKNKLNGMEQKIQEHTNPVSKYRGQIETCREEILDVETNLERQLKSADGHEQQENTLKQTISKLKNDIAALQSLSTEDVETQKKQYDAEVTKLAVLIRKKESEKVLIDQEVEELRGKLHGVNREIGRLENQKEQRMNKLRDVDQNAYQAAKWVDENRHLFSQAVFLPMIVELDVDPKFAKYTENAIGYNDMVAILCESNNDVAIVVENCRNRLGLRVNVLQADANCAPAVPRVSLANLRQKYPQFDGYLSDFVKGPSTLLSFLCHRKGFHNIPVALGDVDTDNFSLYYTGDYRKGYTTSHYRVELLFFSDSIQRSRYFTGAGGDVDSALLKDRAADVSKNIESKQLQVSAMKIEINDMNAKREQTRVLKNKLTQMQATLKTMTFHLSTKEKELARLERSRIDPERVQEDFKHKAAEATRKLVEAQEPFYAALKQLDSCVVERHVLEFDIKVAKDLVSSTKELCKAEKEALEKAEAEAEAITNTYSAVRHDATQQANVIQRKHGKNVTEVWSENGDLFKTLPNSIEDLESHIEDKMAHAQLLGGGNDAEIINRFEAHVRQVQGLEHTIAQKEAKATNLVTDMETKENQWRAELDELVKTIGSNFTRYFSEMKCAGDIKLSTGNNEHDYDNFGLRVRVKFRDNEELQDLNAHTQSGGERAVSTAIYMLSLQELTPAPFRLVDEINQGMDIINERRVYNLLLSSTSKPGTPQYFLLTPKLLKEMDYNPGTTVLCVMNSACAPNHKTWNIQRFIDLRKRLGSNGNHQNGQDADMGDDDD